MVYVNLELSRKFDRPGSRLGSLLGRGSLYCFGLELYE